MLLTTTMAPFITTAPPVIIFRTPRCLTEAVDVGAHHYYATTKSGNNGNRDFRTDKHGGHAVKESIDIDV